MRIALVNMTFLPLVGGAEFVVHNLAVQWSSQGHKVCVMNGTTSQADRAKGRYSVKRFRIPRGSTRFGYHRFPMGWYVQSQLKRLLNDFKPDFISAHSGYSVGLWLSRISPTPRFFVTCHGRDLTKFYWGDRKVYKIDRILTEALNKSAGAIAISTHARELMEELGVEPSKIIDIPNGVDLNRFQTKAHVDVRRKLGIPADAIFILSVGREHPQKAYDTGIKAFAKLHSRLPGAFYAILGRGLEKWRPLANQLGVGKHVILCEGLYGEELVAAYQQADVFFSPSIWEMLALVVLEAMAAGLPQVVTNISGSQDVIKTGINGFVVEPDQPDQMTEALYKLATDKAMRKRMSSACLELSKSYSWERISRMYLEHA